MAGSGDETRQRYLFGVAGAVAERLADVRGLAHIWPATADVDDAAGWTNRAVTWRCKAPVNVPTVVGKGWGEFTFAVPTDVPYGSIVQGPSALRQLARFTHVTDLPVQLYVECPRGMTPSADFPSNGTQYLPNSVFWSNLPQDTGAGLTCVNQTVRFWVGHSTDLITLGIGAVLGLLVVFESRRRSPSPLSPDPSPTRPLGSTDSVEPPSSAKSGSHSPIAWSLVALVAFALLSRACRPAPRKRS